jgi:hypothetical protein
MRPPGARSYSHRATNHPVSEFGSLNKMSENYRFYAAKMAEIRICRAANRPLHDQIVELMTFVETCEKQWEFRLRTEWGTGPGDDRPLS